MRTMLILLITWDKVPETLEDIKDMLQWNFNFLCEWVLVKKCMAVRGYIPQEYISCQEYLAQNIAAQVLCRLGDLGKLSIHLEEIYAAEILPLSYVVANGCGKCCDYNDISHSTTNNVSPNDYEKDRASCKESKHS